ncbi:hypothetical protein B0H13DRAFT_1872340 [Mycena leptocephala]|nr:hypothetical protein B0H13DRAFT_1872340 [Mycena leptocephala]
MAFNRSLISLILAALSLSISAQAPDEPSPGQSLVYDTALSTGPVGGCLTASSNADGAPVIISGCFDGEASVSNTWVATNGTGISTLQIFGDKASSGFPGARLEGPRTSFGPDRIRHCVNVPNGDVTAGTVLQITECDVTFNNIEVLQFRTEAYLG